MLFNELIDAQGLESVVSKTNISSINLSYLLNEEFEELNRVKALGFLLILEREYPEIEVTDLRQRVKLYYEEHKPVDDKVAMIAKGSTTGGDFSFFKLFIISALLGGGYYLYKEGKLDSLINKVENKKDFFDDKKALENNSSNEDAQKVIVNKLEPEEVRIKTPIAPKPEPVTLSSKVVENNKSTTITSEVVTNVAVNQSAEEVVQEVSQEFLANAKDEENSAKKNTPEPTPITTISINPTRGMLWYGFINLDTKKRREFMKKVSTPFSINDGKWLLVTGHGYVDIVSDAKTIEKADNKKHYFYIDKSDIKEINKREFRKLNGHRGW